EQTHLRETCGGERVAWVLDDRRLVRGDRARIVARLDRRDRLLVPGRQRRLAGLDALLGGPRLQRSCHALLGRELEQLRQDLAELRLRQHPGEQRQRASRDDRGEERDLLDAKGLCELPARER